MFKLTKYFLVCCFVIGFHTTLFSQTEEEQAEQMQIWMDYMTPGQIHEMMAKSVGEWKTINKYWMDPSAEPMVTEGTATIEMILGGRYQSAKHTGMVMGMPMEGISLTGYDNASGEFTSIWIDNLGTGTAVAKGKYDEATGLLTMSGSMVDPMTKGETQFKQVLKVLDDNHQVFEMYMIYNGEEVKSLEIEFIR
jgi:hypothetical protein